MVEFTGNSIFLLVGFLTSMVMTIFYVFQIREADGLFSGSLNDYFDLTVQYSIYSGLLVTSFFLTFLLPEIFLSEIIYGLVAADLIFLSLTLVWMLLALKIFQQLSSISERYFSQGDIE